MHFIYTKIFRPKHEIMPRHDVKCYQNCSQLVPTLPRTRSVQCQKVFSVTAKIVITHYRRR